MTFSKFLKGIEKGGKVYIASENYSKYSSVPYYEITISEKGSCFASEVIKTSRTTWKRKLNELVK